jgi:predicted KAP-like P-loop ATPase
MTEKPPDSHILTDLPTDKDALDFTPYVRTLANEIRSPNTATPLTIGVFGTWGSGKTSLMRMVQKQLPDDFQTVWFDA